jgi:hypothetical protein
MKEDPKILRASNLNFINFNLLGFLSKKIKVSQILYKKINLFNNGIIVSHGSQNKKTQHL